MTIPLSERVQLLQPSATLAVSQRAAELRAAGHDVISLGAGEPDFDTPEPVKQAAIDAIQAGQTKYTAVDGTPELKRAVCDKLQRDNGLEYGADEVMVSSGAKHSLFNVMQTLVEPGTEVVIPAPYWVSYPDMVRLAGGVPTIIGTDTAQRFKITPEQLESAITAQTRLFIFNSPSNPTGMAYTVDEIRALGEVLAEHPQVALVTDEIYEHIYWDNAPLRSFVSVCPELRERAIVVNGVSKAYAMTGWRIGFAAGPAAFISQMKKIQGQSTSNPCAISQAAAIAALTGEQSSVRERCEAFKARHDFVVDALDGITGVSCLAGDGTFYAFANFEGAINATSGVTDDADFAEYLLNHAGVALVPGTAFGAPGHLRVSFATDMATLEQAIQRLRECLE